MICNRMYNTVECVLYMKRGLYEGLFLTIFNSIYFLLLRLILHVYRIGTYPNTVWPSELDRRHFFSFTTTTMQQRNRSSRTKKRRKIFRSRCLDGVATANIVIWPENIVTLSRQYCRVPSSGLDKAANRSENLLKYGTGTLSASSRLHWFLIHRKLRQSETRTSDARVQCTLDPTERAYENDLIQSTGLLVDRTHSIDIN